MSSSSSSSSYGSSGLFDIEENSPAPPIVPPAPASSPSSSSLSTDDGTVLLGREHYERCIEQGIYRVARLEEFTWSSPIQKGLVEVLYKIQKGPVMSDEKAVDEVLEELGIDQIFTWVEVLSLGETEPAYCIWANKNAMMIREAFKERDINEEDKKLYPVDAIWQSFLFGGGDPKQLRFIVAHFCVNVSTRTAVYNAARKSTKLVSKEKGYAVYGPLDQGYKAVIGSEIGGLLWRFLHNYKGDIGFRTIEKIVIARLKKGRASKDNARTVFFVLSKPRENPTQPSQPQIRPQKRRPKTNQPRPRWRV